MLACEWLCAGSNVWIEGASIGDGTVIEDNARVVFSVLDKKVRIGEDATVMPWCVLGEEVSRCHCNRLLIISSGTYATLFC